MTLRSGPPRAAGEVEREEDPKPLCSIWRCAEIASAFESSPALIAGTERLNDPAFELASEPEPPRCENPLRYAIEPHSRSFC